MRFHFLACLTCCTCCRMIIRGRGGVLTSWTSTSLTLRKMCTLRMLSYDHQGGGGGVYQINVLDEYILPLRYGTCTRCTCCRMIIRVGGWVCINVLDEHFSDVTEHVRIAHAGAWWSGGGGVCINVLDEHFPYVTEHVASKNQQVYQKNTLGPTAGHGVTTLPYCSLWLLRCHKRSGTEASRRGKNWKSECRPDMIRMIENQRFLMFFFWPLTSKIESPHRHNANFHSWVTRLPIDMNVHVANIFWRLLQIPAFCLLASKIRISNSFKFNRIRHPYKGTESTSCLVFLHLFFCLILVSLQSLFPCLRVSRFEDALLQDLRTMPEARETVRFPGGMPDRMSEYVLICRTNNQNRCQAKSQNIGQLHVKCIYAE